MTALAQALSAALLDFVWQGLAVGIVLALALWLLRKRAAHSRYLASCVTLAVLAALPAWTAWNLYQRPARVAGTAILLAAAQTAAAVAPVPVSWIARAEAWTLPVWSLGVLLLSLRLVWAARQVHALRRLSAPAAAEIRATVGALAARLGVERAVQVQVSPAADSPSVIGWLRPVILLPASTLLGLTPQQLEAVLAHEMAHIRRFDYLVNLLQMLVETLLFYHPVVWLVSARIGHERELCCDDLAVAACGDKLCYARALARLERLRLTAPAMAMASAGGPLLYRIQRLMGAATQEYRPSALPGILALALGLACFALNVHWARGQDAAPPGLLPGEPGVQVDLGGAGLRDRPPNFVEILGPALQKGAQGTVVVEAILDAAGNVSDAHALSGPQELRNAVLQAVLQFRLQPETAGSTRHVSITLQGAPTSAGNEGQNFYRLVWTGMSAQSAAGMEAKAAAMEGATQGFLQDERAFFRAQYESKLQHGAAPYTVGSIILEHLSDAARAGLLSRLEVHAGDTLTPESLSRIEATVRQFDESLALKYRLPEAGRVEIHIAAPVGGFYLAGGPARQ